MSERTSIALVGIGGYGNGFVSALLDAPNQSEFRFAAGIDPNPNNCRRLKDIQAKNIPVYATMEEFFAKNRADLVVLSTPLHLHAAHTCFALSKGSNVICEKPLCVTVDQARQMIRAREATKKHVAIGYQWSFSKAMQQLKADVMSGVLGAPKRLKSLVLWPRDEAYYARNRWAGHKNDGNGNLILDSPVNNACAHYLHNMLYVLGAQVDRSAQPATVTAELYRAHPIQNYDTAALRCTTTAGVELLFIVSHATSNQYGPVFSYEFENATVDFVDQPGATITAKFKDGTMRDYGSPAEPRDRKVWLTINAIHSGKPTLCGIEASLPHTLCVNAAQKSTAEIVAFPADGIQVTGQAGHRKTAVTGLGETLARCYDEWKLPSEINAPWSKPATPVAIDRAV
jgi:predicted dehydrogenase